MRTDRAGTSQQGFTLVEVLVTVVIMGIGLLGVAGLQLAAMRSNHSALLRTQATIAAYDLIDRMRVDPEAFNSKRFEAGDEDSPPAFSDWAEETARMMLKAPADKILGEVDCTDGDENTCRAGHCRVVVRWDDSRGENPALAQAGRETGETVFSVCTRLAQ